MRRRNILRSALAAAYALTASFRVACAMGTPAPAATVVGTAAHACCRREKPTPRRGVPAPCCVTQSDGAPALLPAVAAPRDVSAFVVLAPAAAVALPRALARARVLSRPPPAVPQILAASSLGSRAPPSPA